MNEFGNDLFDDLSAVEAGLTPVKRRRLATSIDIYESPAERIVYQHTVLCQTARIRTPATMCVVGSASREPLHWRWMRGEPATPTRVGMRT